MRTSDIKLIQEYIAGYNAFNIEMMLSPLHKDIVFENITNGETSLSINGISDFKNQAQKTIKLFASRDQKITNFSVVEKNIIVEIDYSGILALDISEDVKANDEVKLKGKSVFTFKDNKIIKIVDIS